LETNQGRPNLPSVGWCTGQSGAPPDSYCSLSGTDLLPFLAQTTVAALGQLTHRTVRCPLPTVGAATRRPWITRPTIGADDHWLTGQSGAPLDSPVNYSRTPPNFPESGMFTGNQPGAPDTVRCTTGQSGVPGRAGLRLHLAKSFAILFFFSLFLTLRQIY
jgi:hypothetical protein